MLVGGVALVLLGYGGWDLYQERATLQARVVELERNQSRAKQAVEVDAKTLAALEADNAALTLQLDNLYRDYNTAMAELATLQSAADQMADRREESGALKRKPPLSANRRTLPRLNWRASRPPQPLRSPMRRQRAHRENGLLTSAPMPASKLQRTGRYAAKLRIRRGRAGDSDRGGQDPQAGETNRVRLQSRCTECGDRTGGGLRHRAPVGRAGE